MDCNPSEEFHRYCKEVDFGEEERYPDCCERSEDGIEKCN
jgi:hypothetical protein